MELRKSIDGDSVYSMMDISVKLGIDKYHIKNWVREFKLKPIHIENRKWYFNSNLLIPFLTYLIYKEKLMRIKKELKQWTIKNGTTK